MKILFFIPDGLGCFVRIYPLMNYLFENSQCDIAYYSFSVSKEILSKNHSFRPVNISIPPFQKSIDYPIVNEWRTWEYYYGMYGFYDIDRIESDLKIYEKAILNFHPDIIVSNLDIYANIIAKKLNIPLISIIQGCFHPKTKSGRICWWESDTFTQIELKKKPCIITNVNTLFEKYNLKPIDNIADLFVGDRTAITSFPEFDTLDDEGDVTYLGPIVDGANQVGNINNVNYDNYFDHSMNNIFLYLGRLVELVTGDISKKFVEKITAKSDKRNYRLIISTYCNKDELDIKESDNIRILSSWIPVDAAYKNSKIVMHHGGHSSSMACFTYKTPCIIVPTNTERMYNAQALKYLNVGKIVDINQAVNDPVIMLNELEEMLDNLNNYYSNIERWNHIIDEKYKNPYERFSKIVDSLF